MTDAAGLPVWDAEFAPFGGTLPTTDYEDPGLRFPGQWTEGETGLFQNWHRDYDPSLGRYIEADPLGLAAGQSLYGYVGADPINFVDPDGLEENESNSTTNLSQQLANDIEQSVLNFSDRSRDTIKTVSPLGVTVDNEALKNSGRADEMAPDSVGDFTNRVISRSDHTKIRDQAIESLTSSMVAEILNEPRPRPGFERNGDALAAALADLFVDGLFSKDASCEVPDAFGGEQ